MTNSTEYQFVSPSPSADGSEFLPDGRQGLFLPFRAGVIRDNQFADWVSKRIVIFTFLIVLISTTVTFGANKNKESNRNPVELKLPIKVLNFHKDSIHKFNLKYPDKKRGFKPYITPILLISTGTALHFSTNDKENFNGWAQENFAYSGDVDDYIQYAPLAVVYSLNALGIKGKNNFGNRSALALKSILLNDLIVTNLKTWTKTDRPNGEARSFPSGHTSFAFTLAHFMHKEYGEISSWYSIGAYTCATTVGLMRVAKNAHWISDVFVGAGIGILSTELVYLTHLYKWDKSHLKNFDIFPFKVGRQKGLTVLFKF